MANQAKPDVNTVWASTGLAAPVSKAKQALGFVAEIPEYDQFNGLIQQISQFLQHVNQEGIPLWDNLTTYNVGSIVKSPVDRSLYRCLAADLLNVAPIATVGGAVNANWQKFAHTDAEIQALIGLYGVTAANLQLQAVTAFTSTGVAPNFALAPTPAITAYNPNLRFRVKFNVGGITGVNTLNVSGLGAKNLKQYNPAGAKVDAVIRSGMLSDVEYDGTDFVVMDALPQDSNFSTPITAGSSLIIPQLQSLLFRDTGAGLLYRTNHDGTTWSFVVTLPGGSEVFGIQIRRSDALVTLPNGLVVPFITGNTVVATQAPGTNNGWLANTAFVATAVSNKLIADNADNAGFDGPLGNPYMRRTSNAQVVTLRPASVVDTATFGAVSSSKNIDTGEIFQYFEVSIGDVPAGGATFNVNFPFAFPTAVSQITSIVLRSSDALTRHVTAAYYSNLTNSGFRLQVDEAAQVVQPASLTAIIAVRGR